MEGVEHNCGVCLTHSLHDCYNILRSSQHRGPETFGIAAVGYDTIDVVKVMRRVDSFSLPNLYKILNNIYHTFLGHVRYATQGKKTLIDMLRDAHPIILRAPKDNIYLRDDHLIIKGAGLVGVHNGQVDKKYLEGIQFRRLVTGTDTERLLRFYDKFGEIQTLKEVPGAFTFAAAKKGKAEAVIMRDRTGIKPGVLGWKDGKAIFASEDFALTENGAEFREDLDPGSVYYSRPDGSYYKVKVVEPSPRNCFFEWNYIARVESSLNGLQVRRLRQELGKQLAREFIENQGANEIDFVTHLPTCPEVAAISFANEAGKRHIDVFYKKQNERAFQGSNADDRRASIKRNLHLIPGIEQLIGRKRIVVIDDSTIRGNNCKWARKLLYEDAHVGEATLLNYTPPIGIIPPDGVPRGCMFGVDIPPKEDENHSFVARNRTIEQISAEIGMPIGYISINGMLDVFERLGVSRKNLCTFCIGGENPFDGLEKIVPLTVSERLAV